MTVNVLFSALICEFFSEECVSQRLIVVAEESGILKGAFIHSVCQTNSSQFLMLVLNSEFNIYYLYINVNNAKPQKALTVKN